MKVLAYSSWFRPTLGRDCGEMLLHGLERRGHEIAAVIGHHTDTAWENTIRQQGWHYVPALPEFSLPSKQWAAALASQPEARERLETWLHHLAALQPEIGISFFASWIPPGMSTLPTRGFINFHPGPLPQLRGYFPECYAILHGFESMYGTIHRVTDVIDTGAILTQTHPVPLDPWDTPLSLLQKISEEALPDIWQICDHLAGGEVSETPQDHTLAGHAGYRDLYAQSFVDWAADDHALLHCKFQVFRGQAHRMKLKADWEGHRWTVWDWELHAGDYAGKPGDFLGHLTGPTRHGHAPAIVRTREGICCIWEYQTYVKEEGTSSFVDEREINHARVLAPGKRALMGKAESFRRWKR